ncbi:branched-chain amino acid ABC transporter permease [Reyranella aquatilis]|uniref:Branched-chain amino acid ABC transporter permease n=1 Tax=Reyranella aquatilis TaxID=2035356 RepID=A0ABS8KQU3_9HYPH|nr:branched-chain amino acid ABC transporter permease [Reyranella aquatilis]MCC8428435.1 branched-chain amino acid ABC transporter permease [Reyranella aquatilis]
MRTVWTMGFVAAAALSFCLPDFIVFRFTQAAIWAIALMGLVIVCGVSGQFSLAQAALFGIGGYGAAMLAAHTALSPYAGLALAPLLGFAAGYGIGRVAGAHTLWTQALVTYAVVIAFPQLLRWRPLEHWTGGVQGLYLDFPPPPTDLLSNDRWAFLMAVAILGTGTWLAHNLIHSRSGRAMKAARDQDLAATAQGIRVPQTRAAASGIAGAYLAVAGCLSAWQFGFVGPGSYNFALSVQMLFGLVIGGMHSLAGAILGGLFLQFFPDVTAGLGKGYSALLYGLLLIAAMVALPGGLAGALARLAAWLKDKRP